MKFYYAVLISYASILPAIGMEHNQDRESDLGGISSKFKSILNIFGWTNQGQTESVVPVCRMTSDEQILFKNEFDESILFPKPNLYDQKDSSQEQQDHCDPSKSHSVSLVSQHLPSQKINQIELEKRGLFCKGCGFYHTMPPEENTGSTNSIKPTVKVENHPPASNDDKITNIPRFNAALSQEEERQHGLENYNRPPAKVKNLPQFSVINSNNKNKIGSYQKQKDAHDQRRLGIHINLAESEAEQGNEALSVFHQTEIVNISDEQEDRLLALSIANDSNQEADKDFRSSPINPAIGVPLELQFLNLKDYEKVQALNKLCQLTHDLSSDSQNKPHEALMTLFGSEGKIKGLWETEWPVFGDYGENPYNLGALYNRMERYIKPQKKHTIIKFHIELVKSIAEELFLCREKNIIDEAINTKLRDNVDLFANHMKILSDARFSPKNLQTKNLQTEMILNDYRKWLGDIKAKTSKGDLLSEVYSGLYDWEEIHTSKLLIEPPLLRMNY